MNLFDYQVSKIIHDERIGQSAYVRNQDANRTGKTSIVERAILKLRLSMASLKDMLIMRAQPASAKSVSRLS